MPESLKWRLVPLGVLAAILSTPLLQHNLKLYELSQTAKVAAVAPSAPAQKVVVGKPARIVVPSAAVDLPVVPQEPDPQTGVWPVSSEAANYAVNSVPANNHNGRTFIYAHATSNLFGPLLDLKAGDTALVYTANHHIFTYRFTYGQDVTPQTTSIFKNIGDAKGLVLMTCDGSYSQYRRLLYFDLVHSS